MLRCEITVRSPADRLLYDGLPLLQPVLDELGAGALLIGGLSTAAWLTARPTALPVRATRDIDLGIDRTALGITRDRTLVGPLMREHGFTPGYADEEFRFAHRVGDDVFVIDLLVAPGASRADPPEIERGLSTIAAPGLAYAHLRGPTALELSLVADERRTFHLQTVKLDAAFVLKAALAASGVRSRPAKRITDTADAVMLAAACVDDPDAMAQLAHHRRRSDVKKAIGWLRDGFTSPRSREANRVAEYAGGPDGGEWAFETARAFATALTDRAEQGK